jgi:colanic acid/amylovoran biosynthesis protein
MLIAIENTVSLNGGDAAILLALIDQLRAAFGADTRFVVFDSDPEVASRYFPEISFRPQVSQLMRVPELPASVFGRRWAVRLRRNAERLLRAEVMRVLRAAAQGRQVKSLLLGAALKDNLEIYRQADLVVSTGGTYLVEHYDLEDRLLEFEKDAMLGKPLVLFTQSMGPFQDQLNRRRVHKVLAEAKLTLLRDHRSLEHVQDLAGDAARCEVLADAVFALADPETLAGAALPRQDAAPRRVAVSVREWSHFSGRDAQAGMALYEQSIARAVQYLVTQCGSEVCFVSTCQGIAEYRYDDSIVARRIAESLPAEIRARVSVDDVFHPPQQLTQVLAGFDMVISTRMHMAILALCAGVPVLPIAYEFKTTELFAGLGQERLVTSIDSIEPEGFEARLIDFIDGIDTYRTAVFPRVAGLSRSARSAAALIREAVEGRLASAA